MSAVSSICRRFFRTDLSFSSASGRGTPIRIWPTAIIGLEPAAVTEYQRLPRLPPCEVSADRRLFAGRLSAWRCLAGAQVIQFGIATGHLRDAATAAAVVDPGALASAVGLPRSEEHRSELQSPC